jgi:hypothetical protein
MVPLKTTIVKALQTTFDGQYPEPDFVDTHVSMEYPMDKQDYPGIWVNYRDDDPVIKAGIAHTENIKDLAGIWHQVSRWRIAGTVSLTIAALSMLEKDRLFDQVVRVLMEDAVDETPAGRFKPYIEDNKFIGVVFNYDEISISGVSASPGTPWETNEVLYETTIDISLVGEFISDPSYNTLVPLSKVLVEGYDPDNVEHSFDVEMTTDPWNSTDWI